MGHRVGMGNQAFGDEVMGQVERTSVAAIRSV